MGEECTRIRGDVISGALSINVTDGEAAWKHTQQQQVELKKPFIHNPILKTNRGGDMGGVEK